MRQRLRSHLTYANVMVSTLAFIVLGGSTAMAATGGSFILGQSNSASSATSLTRTGANTGKGLQVTNTSTGAGAAALGLTVAGGHAPFTVNSGTKVANLNADKLDGLDSTAFVPSSRVRRIHWRVQTTDAHPVILDQILAYGPLHLKGDCEDNGAVGAVSLFINSDAAASANWFFVEEGTASGNGVALPAGSGDIPVKSKTSGRLEGTLIYDWSGGTISVALHAFHIYSGLQSSCEIYGTALHAP